jgi:hypothetical protein
LIGSKEESLMAWWKQKQLAAAAFSLVIVLGVGIASHLGWWHSPQEWSDHGGFYECSRQAGLTFQMQFLPGEQGEKFKINLYDHGCGVAIGDFDGDGYDDIYFVNQLGRNALYHNKGDGTFEDVTEEAGVGLGDRICVGATFADFDNDGLQDLYVTSTRGGNVLFKNLGNGKFKDVTKAAGLNHIGHSQTAVFFDYDSDGYLDLFVTNTAQWTRNELDETSRYYLGPRDFWKLAVSPTETNILYHNNGDGTFTDVTAKAGLAGKGWGGDVAVLDYNEDSYLDLLVTNMFGASQLYRNNGDGTFTDVTRQTLGRTSWGAIGSKVLSIRHDGRLDLLIVDMHSDMWMPATSDPQAPGTKMVPPQVEEMIKQTYQKKYTFVSGPMSQYDPQFNQIEKKMADLFHIHYDEVIFGNTLFKNQGSGHFVEISDQAGVETLWPWGIATGDFNNDGYEDIFLPSGMGYPFFYWPNALLMNNGNATFTDQAVAEGIEPPPGGRYLPKKIGNRAASRSSRCAAVADFRNVGRLDIVTNNFNDHPFYFQNRFPVQNFLSVRLQGSHSNRDAIGAVVRLFIGDEILTRQVNPADGYLSQSTKTLHFGLGDRATIDRLEIKWPRGFVQTIDHPTINQLHHITEPSTAYTPHHRAEFHPRPEPPG